MNATEELGTSTHNARAFAVWAEVYDDQENPLLALEERYLTRLLPSTEGRHVLDVGCGTGRWLSYLAKKGRASSLFGVDSSQEMLQVASDRHLDRVVLALGGLPSLPVDSSRADLLLVSFVLSYVENLEKCAFELARVTRDGGDVFLSDMHPQTAATLGWKRGFAAGGQAHQLQVNQWSLAEIKGIFAEHGFALVACLEPSFGEMEHGLFRVRGKESSWLQSVGMPAIYLLHFRKRQQALSTDIEASEAHVLRNAHCVLGPNEVIPTSVVIRETQIAVMVDDATTASVDQAKHVNEIDLDGYLLYPGLVNAHDHLEFALFPRLGTPPYQNATQWALDIQATETDTINLHRQVPKDVRLWWGGIRNLLCGVTTVCHHNPLEPILNSKDFPVHVVERYGWAHSPAFAEDIASAFRKTDAGDPFLIHACEGIDQTAAEELQSLDLLGVLEERSVLIHGLALDSSGITLLNERHAALIICPSSNSFLFGKTHTREQLRSVQRIALGSDSPLTAEGDFLDEIRFMRSAFNLLADEIYSLVTDQPARILRLQNGEGTLRPDAVADLIAVRCRNTGTPADTLVGLDWRDVELVIVGGRVRLASSEIYERLPTKIKQHLISFLVEDKLRWLPAEGSEFLEAAEAILGTDSVRVGGLRVSSVEV